MKGVEKAHDFYGMVRTVNGLNQRLKEMGLVLGDVFRMADGDYEGEITKEQFMRTVVRLRANLEEQLINEMFYAIDTNLNGICFPIQACFRQTSTMNFFTPMEARKAKRLLLSRERLLKN